MTTKTSVLQKELKEQFFQKIFDDWDTKWVKYPPVEKDEFGTLPSLNAFVEDLLDDIDETLKPRFVSVAERNSVLISKENLRRIVLNKNETRFQTRTLNCISFYLGFQDYEDFKVKLALKEKKDAVVVNYFLVKKSLLPQRQAVYQLTDEAAFSVIDKPSIWKTEFFKKALLGSLCLIVAWVVIKLGFSLYQNRPFTAEQLSKVKFEVIDQYDKEGISTLRIAYDISSLACDSVVIDYGPDIGYLWDTKSKNSSYFEKYGNQKDTLSHTYFKPDIWKIKLLVRGQEIRSLTKIVYSGKNWTSWSSSMLDGFDWKSKPKHPKEIYGNGKLWLSKELIEQEAAKVNYYTTHVLVNDFAIDGDEMFIEARIKNDYFEGGQSCYDAFLGIKDKNQVEANINFIQNCVEYGFIKIANSNFRGNSQNMNFLDIDLQEWRVIGLKLLNKEVIAFVDGKEIFRTRYDGDFSEIKSIGVNFKGSGSVDWIRLVNSKTGKLEYFNDFNEIL